MRGHARRLDRDTPHRTANVPVIMTAAVVALVCWRRSPCSRALLVAGAPLGRFAWGGQHEVLPTGHRIGSVVSIALYAGFAVLILQAAGTLSLLPGRVRRGGDLGAGRVLPARHRR